tara:strand:- start:3718 stop:3828 length:111 start_codon:yes stop_codon:yes gene_type:complete
MKDFIPLNIPAFISDIAPFLKGVKEKADEPRKKFFN